MNIIDSIASFFTTIAQIITNTFSSLLLLIDMLLSADEVVTRIVAVMPPLIGTAGFIFVVLSIVKFILGR